MRISDWGSDGCASDRSGAVRMESDVSGAGVSGSAEVTLGAGTLAATGVADLPIELAGGTIGGSLTSGFDGAELVSALQLAAIGRASGREHEWTCGTISGVDVSLKQKQKKEETI